MIRHAPSIGIGIGLSLRGSDARLDSDVLAFAAESGATDLTVLNRLVKYLKAESLYSNFVIYPMKSAQNAGSGATAYSLGGVTTNNMALVNSPTWGEAGIIYNGTNQYGYVADFLDADTVTVFNRTTVGVGVANGSSLVSQYDTGANSRSFLQSWRGDATNKLGMNRSSDGGSTNLETYAATTTDFRTVDTCIISQWVNGGARFAWMNKSSEALVPAGGTPQTSRLDSSVDITVAAYLSSGSPTLFAEMEVAAIGVLHGAVTTTQRETITDLINAL